MHLFTAHSLATLYPLLSTRHPLLSILYSVPFSPTPLAHFSCRVPAVGLIGAASVQRLLNLIRVRDPITRGLATASAAHGLGTAALATTEPEALPFCALAYGLIGIAASCWVASPAKDLLIFIANS